MTPEQKESERLTFENIVGKAHYLYTRPFAVWMDRAALAHQREADLTAEIARLRDELQLKCNPAEIATQVPEKWRIAVQEFVDRCERGEIRSRRTYSLFKELLTAAPKPQSAAVPDEWREVLAEVLSEAEGWIDDARGCAPADIAGYTGWAERARALLEAAPQPTAQCGNTPYDEGEFTIATQPTTKESLPVDPLAELTAMSQELGVGYGPDNGHLPPEALRVVRFIFRHFGPPHMAAELPDDLVPDIRALEAMFKAQGVIV